MQAFESIVQMAKMLRSLDNWLVKATTYAETKKFDADVLVQSRLAPDQYALVRQVQAACDGAKYTAAYLAGVEAPSHPDDERTMAETRQRIQKVLAYLETFSAEQFAGAADRRVAPRWLQGKWLRGDQYLVQAGLPNFYFHVVTAYAILRHNGVDLGKMDFIASLPVKD